MLHVLRGIHRPFAFNASVERELVALREHGTRGVIIGAMWMSLFDPLKIKTRGFSGPDDQAQYVTAAAERLVDRLTGMGFRVLIVGPIPMMPRSVPHCLARYTVEECSPSRKTVEDTRRYALAALRKIKADHPGTVHLWDPVTTWCNSRTCPVRSGSAIMFTDQIHLSASGARTLLGGARADLEWAVGSQPALVTEAR